MVADLQSWLEQLNKCCRCCRISIKIQKNLLPRKQNQSKIHLDTSSQPAPTICHCSAMMLHLAGFEAAQRRWQGAAPEAQLFAWICWVVPLRLSADWLTAAFRCSCGNQNYILWIKACRSLSELVHVQAMRGVCQATLGRAPPWSDWNESQMLQLVQCHAVPCTGNCKICTDIWSRMETSWALLENVSDLWAQDAPFDLHDNR